MQIERIPFPPIGSNMYVVTQGRDAIVLDLPSIVIGQVFCCVIFIKGCSFVVKLISTVLGTEFPGPGTVYVSQGLNFWRPITIGDTLTITVTCKEKFEHNHHVILDCLAVNQDGLKVIDGVAEVMAPIENIARPRVVLPEVTVSDRALRYRHRLSVSAGLTPIPIAVAHRVAKYAEALQKLAGIAVD